MQAEEGSKMTLDKGNDTALMGAGWTGVITGILRVLNGEFSKQSGVIQDKIPS